MNWPLGGVQCLGALLYHIGFQRTWICRSRTISRASALESNIFRRTLPLLKSVNRGRRRRSKCFFPSHPRTLIPFKSSIQSRRSLSRTFKGPGNSSAISSTRPSQKWLLQRHVNSTVVYSFSYLQISSPESLKTGESVGTCYARSWSVGWREVFTQAE